MHILGRRVVENLSKTGFAGTEAHHSIDVQGGLVLLVDQESLRCVRFPLFKGVIGEIELSQIV